LEEPSVDPAWTAARGNADKKSGEKEKEEPPNLHTKGTKICHPTEVNLTSSFNKKNNAFLISQSE
jgi:hypothetical protein